jgi:hypothetical protein
MTNEENPFKPLPNKRYTTGTLSQHCKMSGELRLNPFEDISDDALLTLAAQSGAGKSFHAHPEVIKSKVRLGE